jgi:exopolyphosphatase/guanosine-5'-triphosphate,3'-diphosphate pyrophosphatase
MLMEYELIAAVDLGSNSFRLQVARVVGDQIYPLDAIKETVRLAGGLRPDKTLDLDSQTRGLAALRQFGERLRGFDPKAVRAVATNTLRVAKNAPQFLVQAEQELGFPIEVIAGREEARLIYLGTAHSLPPSPQRRFVVDIGGGSTEFIIGRRFEPLLMESLYMGCVSFSGRYFPGGAVDRKGFNEAELAAAREIETIAHDYLAAGWHEAVGSSGTAREIADILEQNGLNPDGVFGITRQGVDKLKSLMIKAGSAEKMGLTGMRADRIPVLPGGLAIMSAVFEAFGIERMTYGDGALRLGVLYDLLGRFHHHDMRDATVQHFMQRYQVDVAQAARVEELALSFLEQIEPGEMDDGKPEGEGAQFLFWAARLHEIGISVAHSAYHKHGAYILSFADMPGFSKKDQARLALMVLGHRGKLEKIATLPAADPAWTSIFCLRTAALFCRSRHAFASPEIRVRRNDRQFVLELPAGWLGRNAMSAAALEDEVVAWSRAGFEFKVKSFSAKSTRKAD